MKRQFSALLASIIALVLVFSLPGTAIAGSSSHQIFAGGSFSDGLPAGQPTNHVFLDTSFIYSYSGDPVCLSSQEESCAPFAIDDEAKVTINGVTYDYPSFTSDIQPVDLSTMLHSGDNQIRVQLIDRIGPNMGGSPLYIAASSGGGGGNQCVIDTPIPLTNGSLPVTVPLNSFDNVTLEYDFSISGSRCHDSPATFTLGEDPSFTLTSKSGDVTVSSSGEMDKDAPHLNVDGPHFGSGTSLIPLGLSVYEKWTYNSEYFDFNLKSDRTLKATYYITRSPQQDLAYAISLATIFDSVKFTYKAPAVIPPLAISLGTLFALMVAFPQAAPAPLAYYSQPMDVNYIRLNSPTADVMSDLNSFFGPEFVGASTVSILSDGSAIKGPGQNIHYSGIGFTPNGRVYLTLTRIGDADPTIETEIRANSDGSISGTLRLPNDAKPGRWLTAAVDGESLLNQLKAIVNGQSTNLHTYIAANTTVVPDYTVVKIDVKPDSTINPINLGSNGVTPVAILTTPSFNAALVAPLTTQFGPDAASPFHDRGHIEDVNKDGLVDNEIQFSTQQTGILSTDTSACLFGQTTEGVYIAGCDNITIVPPK